MTSLPFDEGTKKSMVDKFLEEIDHMSKESVKKIRFFLKSILKGATKNMNYLSPNFPIRDFIKIVF
jgi:hypothetical protein